MINRRNSASRMADLTVCLIFLALVIAVAAAF
jgi:hypothetical protein